MKPDLSRRSLNGNGLVNRTICRAHYFAQGTALEADAANELWCADNRASSSWRIGATAIR